MPSPFPGMDPFLESPLLWQGFHTRLITYLADGLNTVLPPGYATNIEERLVVVDDGRSVRPDFAVVTEIATSNARSIPSGGTATLERPQQFDAPRMVSVDRERQHYIEIISLHENRRVVTVVEVLSPSNKRGEGRDDYRKKQQTVLGSDVNLLEIDLLRGGQPTVALPFDRVRPKDQPHPYVVCLNRAANRERVAFWPFGLRDRLPRVGVPLQEDEDDVPLDLQAVFTTTYDRGRYAQQLDYTAEVTPPFEGEEAEWVTHLLGGKTSGG